MSLVVRERRQATPAVYADSPAARAVPRRNVALATVLKEARAEGIYAYQVATAASISPALLSLIVRGRRHATPAVAYSVAEALGVPVLQVFPDAKVNGS